MNNGRAIFVIVGGFAVYTLIRFGRRPASPQVEPAQVYGSTQIELACCPFRADTFSLSAHNVRRRPSP